MEEGKVCGTYNKLLPRHLFKRKEYAKSTAPPTCQQCCRNLTAERCKQQPQSQIKLGRVSDSGVKRRPNNFGYCNYLDKLFSMRCFSDIVSLQAFTSAKDVSESMAAIHGASHYGLNGKRNRVKCLCIGDGSTPRTAVLACFWKQWSCVSIDPALHEIWVGNNPKNIRNLIGYGGTLEEYIINGERDDGNCSHYDHLLLLCVHSHARFIGKASVGCIQKKYNNIPTTLISLPCCPKFRPHRDVGRDPDVEYEDDCVFSACRKVEIWRFPSVPEISSNTTVCQDIVR